MLESTQGTQLLTIFKKEYDVDNDDDDDGDDDHHDVGDGDDGDPRGYLSGAVTLVRMMLMLMMMMTEKMLERRFSFGGGVSAEPLLRDPIRHDDDDEDDDDDDDDYDDDDDDDVDNDHLQKNLQNDVRKEVLVGRMSIHFEAVGALKELFKGIKLGLALQQMISMVEQCDDGFANLILMGFASLKMLI